MSLIKTLSQKISYLAKSFLIFLLAFQLVFPSLTLAQLAQTGLNLPPPGTIVSLSKVFEPALLRGLKVHEENPMLLEFILTAGDSGLGADGLKSEADLMVKYFLAAMTTPNDEVWVNLSPYEGERIVSPSLAVTEMGKTMLSEDYLLKQISASLSNPETKVGQEFWAKVFAQARAKYGTTAIPISTFNKVWIVPDEAIVVEHEGTVFVARSTLKVMLEEDYLNVKGLQAEGADLQNSEHEKNNLASAVMREVIIPELQKEVNQGENFAGTRQIYNAVILAKWYKEALRESLLGKIYVNQKKLSGIDTVDAGIKEEIYQQYISAFKKGAYNLIKEEIDPKKNVSLPRKYFAGGEVLNPTLQKLSAEQLAANPVLSGAVKAALGKGQGVNTYTSQALLLEAAQVADTVNMAINKFKSVGAAAVDENSEEFKLLQKQQAADKAATTMLMISGFPDVSVVVDWSAEDLDDMDALKTTFQGANGLLLKSLRVSGGPLSLKGISLAGNVEIINNGVKDALADYLEGENAFVEGAVFQNPDEIDSFFPGWDKARVIRDKRIFIDAVGRVTVTSTNAEIPAVISDYVQQAADMAKVIQESGQEDKTLSGLIGNIDLGNTYRSSAEASPLTAGWAHDAFAGTEFVDGVQLKVSGAPVILTNTIVQSPSLEIVNKSPVRQDVFQRNRNFFNRIFEIRDGKMVIPEGVRKIEFTTLGSMLVSGTPEFRTLQISDYSHVQSSFDVLQRLVRGESIDWAAFSGVQVQEDGTPGRLSSLVASIDQLLREQPFSSRKAVSLTWLSWVLQTTPETLVDLLRGMGFVEIGANSPQQRWPVVRADTQLFRIQSFWQNLIRAANVNSETRPDQPILIPGDRYFTLPAGQDVRPVDLAKLYWREKSLSGVRKQEVYEAVKADISRLVGSDLKVDYHQVLSQFADRGADLVETALVDLGYLPAGFFQADEIFNGDGWNLWQKVTSEETKLATKGELRTAHSLLTAWGDPRTPNSPGRDSILSGVNEYKLRMSQAANKDIGLLTALMGWSYAEFRGWLEKKLFNTETEPLKMADLNSQVFRKALRRFFQRQYQDIRFSALLRNPNLNPDIRASWVYAGVRQTLNEMVDEYLQSQVKVVVPQISGGQEGLPEGARELSYDKESLIRNVLRALGEGQSLPISEILAKGEELGVTAEDVKVFVLSGDLSGGQFALSEDGQSVKTASVGGIDFDPTLFDLQIKRDGKGVPLPLPMQNLEQIQIQGLHPVIINLVPTTIQNFPWLLSGAEKQGEESRLAAAAARP